MLIYQNGRVKNKGLTRARSSNYCAWQIEYRNHVYPGTGKVFFFATKNAKSCLLVVFLTQQTQVLTSLS